MYIPYQVYTYISIYLSRHITARDLTNNGESTGRRRSRVYFSFVCLTGRPSSKSWVVGERPLMGVSERPGLAVTSPISLKRLFLLPGGLPRTEGNSRSHRFLLYRRRRTTQGLCGLTRCSLLCQLLERLELACTPRCSIARRTSRHVVSRKGK